MINVFINEEYGYAHYWWEYPGTLEDLIVDWNTGYAPSTGKPYQGTMTPLPVGFDPDNPFAAVTAGRRGVYTLCRPGEDPEERACISMEDFFQASMEIGRDDPYLRIGDEIYPEAGELLPDEAEEAKRFNWADWTEDPPYYYHWFEEWKKGYDCGEDRSAQIKAASSGNLSPQETERVFDHLQVCNRCKDVFKKPRSPKI